VAFPLILPTNMLQAVLLSFPENAAFYNIGTLDLVRPSILLGAFFSNVFIGLCCSLILNGQFHAREIQLYVHFLP
jgi:hypothetical protein